MKKLICIMLICICLCSVVACNNTANTNEQTNNTIEATTTEKAKFGTVTGEVTYKYNDLSISEIIFNWFSSSAFAEKINSLYHSTNLNDNVSPSLYSKFIILS